MSGIGVIDHPLFRMAFIDEVRLNPNECAARAEYITIFRSTQAAIFLLAGKLPYLGLVRVAAISRNS
jgi:hypothetical protein